MKPGATITIGGKTYFKNQNGAVVDVTNPAARKRSHRPSRRVHRAGRQPALRRDDTTGHACSDDSAGARADRQSASANDSWRRRTSGRSTTGLRSTRPPADAAAVPADRISQPQQQYDPSSMNQFGVPAESGPGPYGWNPGYGG